MRVLLATGFAKPAAASRLFRPVAAWFGRPEVELAVFRARRLRVPLDDGYWASRLLLDRDYEPEVRYVIEAVMPSPSAFIDGGANVGWWSLYASTVIDDPARVIAVEPAPGMYERLAGAAKLNGGAFTPIRAAVWSRSDARLVIRSDASRHAAAAVEAADAGSPTASVTARDLVPGVTLDELLGRTGIGPDASVVVKLDIEGSEPEALRGARRLAAMDALLVYEDHGRDERSTTTHAVLAAGYAVFWCEPGGRPASIARAADVSSRKREVERGYNLFAARPGTRIHAALAAWATGGQPQKPVP